jgi:hypothetical protein
MKSITLHLRRAILCFVFFFGIIGGYWGQNAGFFGSTQGGLISYDLNGAATVNSYAWETNIGNARTLVLKGGIIHTWKNGGGNVCGGNMYYRVYKQGASAGSFSSAIALGFSSNGSFTTTASPSNISTSTSTDQRWANSAQTIDLRALATSEGTWVVEVYFDASMNTSSNTACNSTQYLNNNNSPTNYRLYFDVMRNPGFEADASSAFGWISDPSSAGWVTNEVNTSNVRSGSRRLLSTLTTGNLRTTARHINYVIEIPASGTNYIHVLGWARTADAGDLAAVGAYSTDGGTNYSGTASATTAYGYARFTISGLATNSKKYVPQWIADSDNDGIGDAYGYDDIIIYTSTSSGADVTDPNVPTTLTSSRSSSNNVLSWTDGADNTSNTSGIEGTLILRVTGDKTGSITNLSNALLDQAYYATVSTTGPTTISDGTNTWTVVSNGTSSATFTDASSTDVTYAVFMRDKAYNYSSGVASYVPNAPTISSFSPSTVYVGTTITITGTNFTNVSAVSIGGVAATSYTVNSTTSISATVAASASSGTISVTTPGGTATSSSSFTFGGYVSANASDWNTTSTWLGGSVPPASSAVTIDHAITVNGTVANAPSSVTINNAKTLTFGASGALTATTVTNNGSIVMSLGGTLNIAAGGTLANGTNTFTHGAGTVTFAGTGTISGTIGFNDVNIAGGVNFGPASTINGTLSINAGGFVNSNAPIYASGSTLKYNSGGTYGRGTEWSATSAAGYPHHVQISTGTILNLGANSGTATARQIAGNMTVDNGTTLSMALNPMTAALTVKGNYFNYGTTILSSSSGGDLVLEGNLTDNATFTANARAIFFRGSNTQSISSSDNPLDIDVARFNKTGGEVLLLQNLLIDETADPVQFAGTSILNLNGYTATFGKTGTASSITMNNTSAIKGSANSHLTIYGDGAFGTINFDQTTPGTSNQLGNMLIQRSSGSVTLGNALSINGSLTLSSGKLVIGANTLTLAGTVASMNETNCLVGSSSSNLTVNGTGTLGTLYFDQTTPGTTNYLNGFTLNRTSSGTMNLANNLQLASLTITNGEFIENASKQLTVGGIIDNNGTLTIENGATLKQTGSGANANTGSGIYNVKQNITGAGGSSPNGRFWYLGGALSDASSTALLSSGNQLWQWNEGSFGYTAVTSGQTLAQGKSYVLRSGQTSEIINFSGSGLYNGTVTVPNLTRTGTSHQFRGCHLVSNPYPSYLDWDLVGKTNVSTTMYVRTALGTNYNILETYNSFNGQGTSISGPAMTKYIAPMQGFWVKVEADGQTGSLSMSNSMRSHQTSGSGLRSSAIDFPAYLRFNMIDGENKDQVILLMSPDATMTLDPFDSEKMSASGYAQFYSTVNAKKLVINGMKNVKAKTSVPLTLEIPTSKSYIFQAEEFNIEDGLILLEDKQEGIIQDLTINPTYSFFGNAGTNTTRFVIHFQLAGAPVLVDGPMELESLGSDELVSENIQIVSNNQGTIIIRMDEGFKPEGSIRIFDASGRLVEQSDFNDQETTIHLNEQAGMYFVEVAAGKLMVKKKIVIE